MKTLKWLSIIAGGLIVLIILALLILPMFVDMGQYRPELEKRVSEATGRPFRLGGDLELSLFPWAGLSLSDLHLGNPPGFREKDFLSVKSFEVRVKIIPLLSRDIQVKRFILDGARISLEKNRQGIGNWEGFGKPPAKAPARKEKGSSEGEGLPIKALAVGEFSIKDGAILWIDHAKGERREISQVSLRLQDVSLDRPVRIALSANLDGQPISLEGRLGPLGKDPGKGSIPIDMAVKAMKELNMIVKGKIVEPVKSQQFDLDLQISPFSPRKLMAALGRAFPVQTADPNALNSVSLKARIQGDPKTVSISDGLLNLDQSRLAFSAKAMDFSKPDLTLNLQVDKIALDRYLPPGQKKTAEAGKKPESPGEKKSIDYTPLQRLILDGTIRIGELTAKGAKVQDVLLKVMAKNGIIRVDPLSMKLYHGDLGAIGTFDASKGIPVSKVALDAKGIQVGPFIQDLMQKDFLEGTLKAAVDVSFAGDDPEKIRHTLTGQGELLFKDGAIVGIDLPGMVRNIKASFGLAQEGGGRPKTDFSELRAPFTIKNGLVNTTNTTMASPLLRLLAKGNADLVSESLDFRVEPQLVATLKGQDDTKERAGIAVPVLVTGTFSSPKFAPDLEGILRETLKKGLPKPSRLKDILKPPAEEKGQPKSVEEKVKDILKGLPFGK